MSMPLFLDTRISMTKVAASIRLEDDADRWATEILKEGYKNLPILKNYEADIQLDRVDAARGYAVGKLLVYPSGLTKEAAYGMKKLISVPVIVRDRELAPFDVYSYGGKMLPMDEEKVQGIMTRSEQFTNVAPRDRFEGTNLFGQLTPPNTDHQYNAGSLTKQGSAPLWAVALEDSLVSKEKVASVKATILDHPGLSRIYSTRHTEFLLGLESHHEKTASVLREERQSSLRATVTQVEHVHGKFLVKHANHTCWAPQQYECSRWEVQTALSPIDFDRVLRQGWVTFVADPCAEPETVKVASANTDYICDYSTWLAGREYQGLFIPHVMSWDGKRDLGQLFLSDHVFGLQEKIAGFEQGYHRVEGAEPRGYGVFVHQDGSRGFAYEPVTILNKVATATSEYYAARSPFLGDFRIYQVAGLQQPYYEADELYIPDTLQFVPVSKTASLSRLDGETQNQNFYEAQKRLPTSAVLSYGDGGFRVSGPGLNQGGLDQGEAEFLLGGFGVDAQYVGPLAKVARVSGMVTIPNVRPITTEAQATMAHVKTAATHLQRVRQVLPQVDTTNLLKSVALLTSPEADELYKAAAFTLPKETVDAILSLNFVTPENASAYLAYLPLLEKTSSALAELLVASRLGFDDVREAAALNAMTQVNAVVRGLSMLGEKVS